MITVDTTKFDQAIAFYAEATRKDLAVSANRGVRNACFMAVKHAAQARRADIVGVVSNKLVAWILAKQGQTETVSRKRISKRGTWITYGGRVRYFAAKDLREMKRRIIGSRTRAISFLKGFLLRMARAMDAYVPGKARAGRGKNVELRLNVRPASPARPVADIIGAYTYKRRSDQTIGARAERILQNALNRGIGEATADMIAYAQKKLAERAAAISR